MTVLENSINLSQYGINSVAEVVYNPSYEILFIEETKDSLSGFDKGVETESGAVNVDTGEFTGRSPKDKYIVKDDVMIHKLLHLASSRFQTNGLSRSSHLSKMI